MQKEDKTDAPGVADDGYKHMSSTAPVVKRPRKQDSLSAQEGAIQPFDVQEHPNIGLLPEELASIDKLAETQRINFPRNWRPKVVQGLAGLDPNIIVFEDEDTKDLILWSSRDYRKGQEVARVSLETQRKMSQDYLRQIISDSGGGGEGKAVFMDENGELKDVVGDGGVVNARSLLESGLLQSQIEIRNSVIQRENSKDNAVTTTADGGAVDATSLHKTWKEYIKPNFGNATWLTAFSFGVGVLVIGPEYLFVFLEVRTMVNILNWISNALFLVGGYSQLLEVINPGKASELGKNVRHVWNNFINCKRKGIAGGSQVLIEEQEQALSTWKWFAFESRSLAFWAIFSQFLGCCIFVCSSFNQFFILDTNSTLYNFLVNGMNVVGWIGFALYGWFLMLEIQPRWHVLVPRVRAWRAQFYNFLAGAIFAIGTGLLALPNSTCDTNCKTGLNLLFSVVGSALYIAWGVLIYKEETEAKPKQ